MKDSGWIMRCRHITFLTTESKKELSLRNGAGKALKTSTQVHQSSYVDSCDAKSAHANSFPMMLGGRKQHREPIIPMNKDGRP